MDETLLELPRQRLPEWLRRPAGNAEETVQLKKLLREAQLHTVCEEARCPNISECFRSGTATFMILGDVCTRGCRFCSIKTGKPHFSPADFHFEAQRVAEAAKKLKLRHVVVTSVARDDLADGGAEGFVETLQALRSHLPEATLEVLIPDFRGAREPLKKVLLAKPHVLNHNLETVPRLYRRVRPGALYTRSLELLRLAKEFSPLGHTVSTKTGIMLGLGETRAEILQLLDDCREYDIDIFTAGQYMQPTREHLSVVEYLHPDEFCWVEEQARARGFQHVFVGPLVRSSYHAGEAISHT